MIRTAAHSWSTLRWSCWGQSSGCRQMRQNLRRMIEPPACPSVEEIPRWQCEIMWVIDKFEKSYFYRLPLFLSLFRSLIHVRLFFEVCFLIDLNSDCSSLIYWQAAPVSQAGSASMTLVMPKSSMAWWLDNLSSTWQAPDNPRCTSGRYSQRLLSSVSLLTKVCLFHALLL